MFCSPGDSKSKSRVVAIPDTEFEGNLYFENVKYVTEEGV